MKRGTAKLIFGKSFMQIQKLSPFGFPPNKCPSAFRCWLLVSVDLAHAPKSAEEWMVVEKQVVCSTKKSCPSDGIYWMYLGRYVSVHHLIRDSRYQNKVFHSLSYPHIYLRYFTYHCHQPIVEEEIDDRKQSLQILLNFRIPRDSLAV